MNTFNCKENGCKGLVGVLQPVLIQSFICEIGLAYPCNECSRLYWENEALVFDKNGDRAFLKGERVAFRDKKGAVVATIFAEIIGIGK